MGIPYVRKTPIKTILVYNPISGHGHLDSWHALFVKILLERGYRVLAVAPNDKALGNRLGPLLNHPELRILPFIHPLPATVSRKSRYFKKRLLRMFFKMLKKLGCLQDSPYANQGFDPRDTCDRIRYMLAQTNETPALIFNMYLDIYEMSNAWKYVETLRIPWSGARFVPRVELPLEPFCVADNFKGLCLFERKTVEFYQKELPSKVFALLPDITDTRLPQGESDLARQICQQAQGRCTVFIGGSLTPRKNFSLLMDAIEQLPKDKWFFAVVGSLYREQFSQIDIERFDRICADPQSNVFVHDKYLEDEGDFNAAIAASTILLAVYKEFPGSSNLLTKAAFFEKPILVSDRYLMGERVCRYGIGMAVSEDDPKAALEALEQLRKNPISPDSFAAYRDDFNETVMGDAFEKFIASSLQTQEELK